MNQLYLSCDNRVTMSTLGHGLLGCSAHTRNQAHCNVMMQTTFTSSTGVKIPAIRLGTFQSKGQEWVFFIPAVRPTKSTYLSGLYRSPRGHTSAVKRKDIFITTKVCISCGHLSTNPSYPRQWLWNTWYLQTLKRPWTSYRTWILGSLSYVLNIFLLSNS